MNFRNWMEHALYREGEGYYSSRTRSLPDYVTAPSFGPYLGHAIAGEIASWALRHLPDSLAGEPAYGGPPLRRASGDAGPPEAGPRQPAVPPSSVSGGPSGARSHSGEFSGRVTLVEAGCGAGGELAASIMERLRDQWPGLYDRGVLILADRSPLRLERAVEALGPRFPGKVFGCPGIDQLPSFRGFVVSNELLDAFPAHLIRRGQNGIEEAYVDPVNGLRWNESLDHAVLSFGADLPLGAAMGHAPCAIRRTLAHSSLRRMRVQDSLAGEPAYGGPAVPSDSASEGLSGAYALNLEALTFLETVAQRMESGFVLSVDFGDTRPAVFELDPVKAFTCGKVKEPDWSRPGGEDITCPVDFSLLMEWGQTLGLEPLRFETLGNFLIRLGVGGQVTAAENRAGVAANQQIKTLIHPYGFGQDFKVLIQEKRVQA